MIEANNSEIISIVVHVEDHSRAPPLTVALISSSCPAICPDPCISPPPWTYFLSLSRSLFPPHSSVFPSAPYSQSLINASQKDTQHSTERPPIFSRLLIAKDVILLLRGCRNV